MAVSLWFACLLRVAAITSDLRRRSPESIASRRRQDINGTPGLLAIAWSTGVADRRSA
jgi:hypothetical protein